MSAKAQNSITDQPSAAGQAMWVAGGKAKYYRHLSDWARFTGGDPAQVDGITHVALKRDDRTQWHFQGFCRASGSRSEHQQERIVA